MKEPRELSPADQELLKEFQKRYREAQNKRPAMSDEEFMAETEASDEEYRIGLVLPGIGTEHGGVDE